jgi:hypothetical protein
MILSPPTETGAAFWATADATAACLRFNTLAAELADFIFNVF